MYLEEIIKILSSHRQSNCLKSHDLIVPRSLSLSTISRLIACSLPPDHTTEGLLGSIHSSLIELQAQGEVLAGKGNRFCMAPPAVLAKDKIDLTGVVFRGDRAYLRMAHQALETDQPDDQTTNLHPKSRHFYRLKGRLNNYGIRLLTVTDEVENLPSPERPQLYQLAGEEWLENPFQLPRAIIQTYIPSCNVAQHYRWQPITQDQITTSPLLQLPTGEYLWWEAEQCYGLTPDQASLAMFWLDKKMGLSVPVPWDEDVGRLNLQGIQLPSAYAQWFWRLSTPDTEQFRTRLFKPAQRPFVCQALTRLGCTRV